MRTRKITALLEVLGVFIAGNFAAGYVGPLMGIKPLGLALQSGALAKPDFIAISVEWLKVVCLQYACLLPLAFGIGWWRSRLSPRHYGVTRAGNPILKLVVLGLLVFALVALPIKLLWLAKRFIPPGPQPVYWALLDNPWTPSFWLFLAVSSVVVTPMFEEFFYRGYCQTRLEEQFGGVGAIWIVTLFMTLGHDQYHHLSILSIGTIIGLIPISIGAGYVYWRSRSLIPAIVLHGAVNLPTKGIYDFVLPAAMIAALILFPRKWLTIVCDFCRSMACEGWKRSTLVAAMLAITAVVGFDAGRACLSRLGSSGLRRHCS